MPLIRTIDFETTGMAPPDAKVIEYGFTDLLGRADDLKWNAQRELDRRQGTLPL